MQTSTENPMYMVNKFSDCLTAECDKIYMSTSSEESTGYQKKFLLTEKLSKYIN